MVHPSSSNPRFSSACRFFKGEIQSHANFSEFVNKFLLSCIENHHEATYRDLGLMEAMDINQWLNLCALMIKHMAWVVDSEMGVHALSYIFFLTHIVEAHRVPLYVGKLSQRRSCLTWKSWVTLERFRITQLLLNLKIANIHFVSLSNKNALLKVKLMNTKYEISLLKEKMIQEKMVHNRSIVKLLMLVEIIFPSSSQLLASSFLKWWCMHKNLMELIKFVKMRRHAFLEKVSPSIPY